MSNRVRFETDEFGCGLDASTARRQFWLSLGAGLAVLAVAAMIDLRPTRVAADAPSARHGQVSAPEFVAPSAAAVQLRRSATVGAPRSAN